MRPSPRLASRRGALVLALLSFVMTLSTVATAQEPVKSEKREEDAPRYEHMVGFTAGVTTGLGLSYRGTYERWFGQVALMPIWRRDQGGSIFMGGQLGRIVQGSDSFYLNLALGTGFMLVEDEVCTYPNKEPFEPLCGRQRDTYLAAGPSVGLGKVWGEHFLTEIYLPVAVVWEMGTGFHSLVPYPGISLGYKW